MKRRRTTSKKRLGLFAFLVSAAALLVGCGFEGSSGELRFVYESEPSYESQRMAVDSKVRFDVSPTTDPVESDGESDDSNSEGETELTVTSATSSDDSVISVERVGAPQSDHLQLAAQSAGTATIEVEAEDATGKTYMDSFEMEAADVAQLSIGDACSLGSEDSNSDPVYLKDQRVRLAYELQDSSGDELAGWGYYPVSLSRTSDGSAVQSVEASGDLVVKIGSTADPLEVTSDIGSTSFTMDVRDPSAIDGLRFPLTDDNGDPTLLGTDSAGEPAYLFVGTSIGDRPVCQSRTDLSVSNQSSSVCSVSTQTSSVEEEGDNLLNFTPTTVQVEKESSGTCSFELSVPASSNSVSQSLSFDLD